jgi:hypothetical protein
LGLGGYSNNYSRYWGWGDTRTITVGIGVGGILEQFQRANKDTRNDLVKGHLAQVNILEGKMALDHKLLERFSD